MAAHIEGDLVIALELVLVVAAAAVDAAGLVDGEVPVVVETELVLARHEVGGDGEDVGLLVPFHRGFLRPGARGGGADQAEALNGDHVEGVQLLVELDHIDARRDGDVVGDADGTLRGDIDAFLAAHSHDPAEVILPFGVGAEFEEGVAAVFGGQVEDAFVVALDGGGLLEGGRRGGIPALVAARGVVHIREGGHIGLDVHRGGTGRDAFRQGGAAGGHAEGHAHGGVLGAAGGDDGLVEGVDRRGVARLFKTFGEQVILHGGGLGGRGLVGDGAQIDIIENLLAIHQTGRCPVDEDDLFGGVGGIQDQLVRGQGDHGRDGVSISVDGHTHRIGDILVAVVIQDGYLERKDEGIIRREVRESGVEQVLEVFLAGLETGGGDVCKHLRVVDISRFEHIVQAFRKVPVGVPGEIHILIHGVGGHQDVRVGEEFGSDGIRRERIFLNNGTGGRSKDQCGNRQYVFKSFHNADCQKVTSLYS